LSCHSSAVITWCLSTLMHVTRTCTQFLEPEYGLILSQIAYLPDVTHWACLGCSGSTCTTATINSLINSMQTRSVALHEANGGYTRHWLVFWSRPLLFLKVSVTNRCISIFPVMWNP
jgi:hypothetical protein